jgi:peptidoglycan/LPS O-acetylase OafA/YrhL
MLYSFVILPVLIALSAISFYGFENPVRKKLKQLRPAKAC